jgi:hypothetical protein
MNTDSSASNSHSSSSSNCVSANVVSDLRNTYRTEGIVRIPRESFPALPTAAEVKELSDCIVALALSDDDRSGRINSTQETIRVSVGGNVESRRVLTRLENFVTCDSDWAELCCTGGILSEIVGLVCSEDDLDPSSEEEHEKWCLYKEKLNIKPAGGTGFAPHVDSPSLQVVGLCDHFVTLMVALDDMTAANGCLCVSRGSWPEGGGEGGMCETGADSESGDPDAGGRRGALRPDAADVLVWEDVECRRGDVYIFSGWIPHRSGVNATQLPRRAVFLTYNSPEDGELREDYYRAMRKLRADYEKMSNNSSRCPAIINLV